VSCIIIRQFLSPGRGVYSLPDTHDGRTAVATVAWPRSLGFGHGLGLDGGRNRGSLKLSINTASVGVAPHGRVEDESARLACRSRRGDRRTDGRRTVLPATVISPRRRRASDLTAQIELAGRR